MSDTAAVDNGVREQSLLNHGIGKGDKPRCGWSDQFKRNFASIALPKDSQGFVRVSPGKLRKVYK